MARESVLIVDDNPGNLKLLSFLLMKKGYAVRTATNADEVLAAMNELIPRLVLMDIQLPGVDGLTLTRMLRTDPRTRDMVVVAVTAYAMKGDKQKALDAGCDAYITKPIDTRSLPATLDAYLARRPAERPTPATMNESLPNTERPSPPASAAATILLVEDNPITRKMVRFTLEGAGLVVIDAPDARTALTAFAEEPIALVLQDLCLPDMDGFELVTRLRALPRGAETPILAFSGMLSHYEETRASSAGFDDLISKPVEPSHLLQIVRTHLPPTGPGPAELVGKGCRIVVADDDPVQRKLTAFRMQKLGFDVVSAADGNEALDQALRTRPDAVVSDVLMPGLDGFGLCVKMRRDPALARTPVVLTTNSYVEPNDRELARKVGAYDLVLRTPELGEVCDALQASLSSSAPLGPSAEFGADLEREHMRRMVRQLERQVALNAKVRQRCALLSAEISVLRGISEALASHEDIDGALKHTLAACFDAGGISLGALYLKEDDELRVLSFGFSKEWGEDDLAAFFGEPTLFETAIRSQSTTVLPSSAGADGRRLLAKATASSALIVPIAYGGVALGALLMLARDGDLASADRIQFGEAVANQISQALAVARAFKAKAAVAEQLALSNADLQQFAYVASHDLQEPLRTVATFTELLAERCRGRLDAEADEFIGFIVNGAKSMERRIRGLLERSRAGAETVDLRPTDCDALLQGVLAGLHRAIGELDAVVTHDRLPTVMADETQLGQVFQNLIGNALKFHGVEPPTIHVGVAPAWGVCREACAPMEGADGTIERSELRDPRSETVFYVRDNGMGIAPEHHERVFKMFERLDPSFGNEGVGMGLAICRKIVERHGGRIRVESRPGEGATFYFALPDRGAQGPPSS